MRPPERTVWRDALIVVLGTAIAAVLCVQFNISEALRGLDRTLGAFPTRRAAGGSAGCSPPAWRGSLYAVMGSGA